MNCKRFLAGVCAAAMVLTAGCGAKEESEGKDGKDSKPAETTAAPEKEPETDEEWEQAMLDKAMVSYGNTVLVRNVIDRAQAGDEVTLAYLGGSITEGLTAGPDDCYAKLTYDYFAEKFGTGDNVKYCNAGISGTPSKLGILRLDRDVLAYEPDLVFIEFAVNDGMESDYKNAYESIVKTLLQKDIAVVLLFSVTKNDHSAQDYMKQIGEAYMLPMISYCDALRYLFENGRMTWEDFSDDESHPNKEGHKMVASMIDYYFDTVTEVEPEGEYIMPFEDVFSPREVDAHMAENDALTPVELGSWVEGSDVSRFTNGWKHDPTEGNEPIVFRLEGKFIYLIYKEVSSGNYGKIHVKVTLGGETVSEGDYDSVTKDGWGDPLMQNIVMDTSAEEYEIEISMAEGDEDKTAQVLGFGYTL